MGKNKLYIILISIIVLFAFFILQKYDFKNINNKRGSMTNLNADYWINKLQLQAHPEGGYFREIYRSDETLNKESLPDRYSGKRNFATSIYFLLKGKDKSLFHKLKSDEIWHFYSGSPLTVYIIDENGKLQHEKLGGNFDSGEQFQIIIKKGLWFGAEVNDKTSFSLIGCTVSPGFDFNDFELGERDKLLKQYPEHKNIIDILTKE
jgi:uncharacterized protein